LKILNQKDFASGVGFIALGAATALGALRYDLGSASAMGPGYFPLMTGMVLAFLGILVAVGACGPGAEATFLDRWNLRVIATILVALALFALTIESLGLVVALPLLVLVSSFAHPEFSWRMTLLLVAILLPLIWAIFVVFLGLAFRMLPDFIG
jgi:Tripartite tricarboxylate transporter TctB family